MNNFGVSDAHFDAAFFADSCVTSVSVLPIGEFRMPPDAKEVSKGNSLQTEHEAIQPAVSASTIQVDSGAGTGPYYDESEGPELDASWFWLNEERYEWSLNAVPGYLRITTDEGDMADKCRNQKNILLRKGPSGSFYIQTKVLIDPLENYQQRGLVIYDDMDHYVKLDLIWSDSILKDQNSTAIGVELLSEEDGKSVVWPWPTDILRPNPNGVLLKLTKSGSWYDGYYSVDGFQWIRVGSLKAPSIRDPYVGLFALTGFSLPDCRPTASQIPVDFDYFYICAEVDVVGSHSPIP